ncbi:ornithine cyclodeaminase family protein [Kineococcus sp. R86509]|uniref:ornithine cyclodeaminase family protein n=1 Tax=Kineococcus sp. R86509 TaxID=3093851 RepID=UPI0036D30011
MTTRILQADDCERLLRRADAVDALERAHTQLARGGAVQPRPLAMRDPHDSAADAPALVPMTALAPYLGRGLVKMLADAPANRALGRAAQRSTAALFATDDAECLALIDGAVLTRMRTAAVSVLATRVLARLDSEVLGLVGAGPLAVEHAVAHHEVLGIKEVVVWSRSQHSLDTFRDAVTARAGGLRVTGVEEVYQVFETADVVCTLTPSESPLVTAKLLRPGLHLSAVGSPPRPEYSELDPDVFEDIDRVVVDDHAVARGESGNIRNGLAAGTLGDHEITSLGEVLAGSAAGRARDSDVTFFNSVGLGLQDLAVLDLLHREAVAADAGQQVSLRP